MNPLEPPFHPAAVVQARHAEDLLAIVPYRLGFHPEDSLVTLALDGSGRLVGLVARVDLPPLEKVPEVAGYLVSVLGQHQVGGVLLVAYADTDAIAGPLVGTLRRWLTRDRVEVLDAFRSDGSRWFCYTCDQACCPSDGTPYDLLDHPLVAEQVYHGQVALPDREALRAQVAAVSGDRRAAMEEAFARAATGPAVGLTGADPGDHGESVRLGITWIRELVGGWLARPRPISDDEAARLAVLVARVPIRDIAWSMMSQSTARRHLGLWQQVLTTVLPPYEPAVACLTAFAAWLDGNGALAWCAVERAREADPEYSWAGLIVQVLEGAVPPSTWRPVPLEEIERFACRASAAEP